MGKSCANERNESSLSNCRMQPALSIKEGRVDFRKNLRFKGGLVDFRKPPLMLRDDRQLFERTLIINKKTNIIYNVSTYVCLHYILY